jgi:hypothetical protein
MQRKHMLGFICLLVSWIPQQEIHAQTEWDAIMMNKNQFCTGPLYTYSSWKNYWEGTLKRDNLNIGRVTTQSVTVMANYGITDNLNIMAAVPYVWTEASAGTLTGLSGVQDFSAFVKWRAVRTNLGKGKLSVYAVGGISTPLSDYVIDFLPLSIGLGSTNLTARGMVDFIQNKISVTGSAAYVLRSNVTLDRSAYYDTELRHTNEVQMPDAAQFQLRAGYRGTYLIAEALVTNWTTLGGFDITRNNMPFPSNRMNSTTAGLYVKYTVKMHANLSVLGSANFTLAGRNMGQANAYSAGVFYAFYFNKQSAKK